MYPPRFRYHRPRTISEAVDLLGAFGEAARPLAGGQSLIPMMKLRLAAPENVVDLSRIEELGRLSHRDGMLHVGAMVRHRDFQFRELPGSLALLADAAHGIADQQVRNRGTMAGSLANADPAGDWAPALLALGAELDLVDAKRGRRVGVGDFLVDAYATVLESGEIVREVRIPVPAPTTGSAFLAVKRRTGDFALASAAATVEVASDGSCVDARLTLGNVAPTARSVSAAAALLCGRDPLDAEVAGAVGDAAAAACDADFDDPKAVSYKRALARTLAVRALARATRRARGETVHVHDQR